MTYWQDVPKILTTPLPIPAHYISTEILAQYVVVWWTTSGDCIPPCDLKICGPKVVVSICCRLKYSPVGMFCVSAWHSWPKELSSETLRSTPLLDIWGLVVEKTTPLSDI